MLNIAVQLAHHIAAAINAQAPVVKNDNWYGGGLSQLDAQGRNQVIATCGVDGCNAEFVRGMFGECLRIYPVAVHPARAAATKAEVPA